MKRIVLFWIPLLLLLLVNCTTESFDFGDQEGILVEIGRASCRERV